MFAFVCLLHLKNIIDKQIQQSWPTAKKKNGILETLCCRSTYFAQDFFRVTFCNQKRSEFDCYLLNGNKTKHIRRFSGVLIDLCQFQYVLSVLQNLLRNLFV